jgi:hypothetical protein
VIRYITGLGITALKEAMTTPIADPAQEILATKDPEEETSSFEDAIEEENQVTEDASEVEEETK